MAILRIRLDGELLCGALAIGDQVIDFSGARLLLGRDEGCDIRIRSAAFGISRRHVELDHAAGKIRIRDLSSPQGIFRNRQHLASEMPWPMIDGDVIRIGGEDIQVRIVPSK